MGKLARLTGNKFGLSLSEQNVVFYRRSYFTREMKDEKRKKNERPY
jgi:hypothetical protein